jgi:hypothetical protein
VKLPWHIALSFVILFTAHLSFAQSYSTSPNDTFKVVGYMEDLQTLTISQLNLTNDTLYFQWEKVSETVPANWEASVCDNKVCYTTLMDTGSTNPVFGGDSGFLLLHVTAHVNYGTAVVRYAIWDIDNPALKDTLTFITTVSEPSDINEKENRNAFNIFPNPARNKVSIISPACETYSLTIFNSAGDKIYSADAAPNHQLSTADWLSGIYFVQLKSNNQFITQKIIKQ